MVNAHSAQDSSSLAALEDDEPPLCGPRPQPRPLHRRLSSHESQAPISASGFPPIEPIPTVTDVASLSVEPALQGKNSITDLENGAKADTRRLGKSPSLARSLVNIAKHSWLNVLLVFIPVSWAVHFTGQSPTAIFCTSVAAIVPLAALLGFATEELALRVGDTFGGLLNATFGNAVELIIAILALVKGELEVVQSSMLGSILSNCLLVLGTSFFVGGLRFHEQGYGIRAAQLNISLLGISVLSIVIPAAFHATINSSLSRFPNESEGDILKLSRGIAIILLFVYASSLVFQLWTHAYIFSPKKPSAAQLPLTNGPQAPTSGAVFRLPHSWRSSSGSSASSSKAASLRRASVIVVPEASGQAVIGESLSEEETAKVEQPKLSVPACFGLMIAVTVVTGFTAEWLVESISGLVETTSVSTTFVALILLPLVGNAAEHVTAVTVATRNKLDLSMSVAVGSSIQISLFVLPLLICLGWIIGQPLTLFFDPFETIVLFISILIVNWAIQDGRTNWLEGEALMLTYAIIALVIWYYPGSN